MDDVDRPVVRWPGEGETIVDRAERTIRILAERDDLTVTWFRYEPGEEGPQPHVHKQHADAFYVLEGELEVGLGPDVRRMTGTAGTFAAAPPNVVHTFRNASEAGVVFLNIHAPSMGFGEMLRASRDGTNDAAGHFDQFDPPTDGGRPFADGLFRAAGEGDSITSGGSRAVLKAEGSEVDGFFSLSEIILAPGFSGPVPHRHRALVDSFYVLAGALSLQLDDEHVAAGPGTFTLVPPGNVHTFANRAEETVRMLNVIAPGGLEQYLKELAGAAPAGPPDPELMAEIASRYDFEPA
jgi:mannose-6-phosphate isomerase-like protein (cupin superfamily)